ncbi:MAG: hypothetical protein JXM71_08110 [Spirochaetales bacterium]|nr:hypothetical protein [Spirochaetales bacterium]
MGRGGSLGGAATAFWLTRDYTEGRNVGNVASAAFIDASPDGVAFGLPLPVPILHQGADQLALYLPVLEARY